MSGQIEDPTGTESTGDEGYHLDRRSLIKKAGVAGAAVWVAPLVVESMISPASAASLAPGLYQLRISSERCNPAPVLDPNVPQTCLPADWGSATLQITSTASLADFGITVENCYARYVLRLVSAKPNVTFTGGTSCRPTSQGGGPNPGQLLNADSEIVWPGGTSSDRNGYFIVVQVT